MASANPDYSKHGLDYRNVEKDPLIDLIRTEIEYAAGGVDLPKGFLDKLSYNSGVSVGTLRAWLYGTTKRPQSLSTRFVLEALGVTARYFRNDGTEVSWIGHNSRNRSRPKKR